MDKLKFLADTMLGSLAKKLRLIGIDTAYISDPDNSELKYLVRSQSRVLLTRDLDLAKSLADLAWSVKGGNLREEYISINEKLKPFHDQFKPFSRCLDCNDPLQSMEPAEAAGKVPPFIYQSRKTFSLCPSCGKVFWEGTHRERMEGEVQWMRGVLQGEGRLE